MPLCGATFDENTVPPWTRGDRGVLDAATDPPRRSATAVAPRHPSSQGGDFQERVLASRSSIAEIAP